MMQKKRTQFDQIRPILKLITLNSFFSEFSISYSCIKSPVYKNEWRSDLINYFVDRPHMLWVCAAHVLSLTFFYIFYELYSLEII